MTISDIVRVYLKNKPYTVEALEAGIVNFSALARIVQRDLRIRNYHAIKGALRRYSIELRSRSVGLQRHAMSILKGSTVTIESGINVVISEKDVDLEKGSKLKVGSYYVYLVTDKAELRRVRGNAIKLRENASAVVIHSEERLESSPGFVAFVASLLAEQRINIIEFVSCYTDTLIVVSKADALKSHELLMGMLE